MKLNFLKSIQIRRQNQILEKLAEIFDSLRRNKIPLYLFLVLNLNVLLAPAVFAVTDGAFTRGQSYATAMLILLTVALGIYLFFVMFFPEKF